MDGMPIMKWSEELSVEVNEIDLQHQRLIDLINNLHDAMLAKKTHQSTALLRNG